MIYSVNTRQTVLLRGQHPLLLQELTVQHSFYGQTLLGIKILMLRD